MHRLRYAGCDLSKFSAPVTMYVTEAGLHHAHAGCWRKSYYHSTTAVQLDPTSVNASKACGICFHEVLDANPSWKDVSELGQSITPDDARFLRSALNSKSKKNVPENAVLDAQRLDGIARDLPTWMTGEAARVRSDLASRAAARARALRASQSNPQDREKALRQSRAVLASDTRHQRVPVSRELRTLLSQGGGNAERVVDVLRTDWSKRVGDGELPHVATGHVLDTAVTGLFHLSAFSQLSLDPKTPFEPGMDLQAWLKAAWVEEVRVRFLELAASWGQCFEGFERDEEVRVVRIPFTKDVDGTAYESLRLRLVNAYATDRASDGSAFAIVPASVVTYLDLNATSNYARVPSAPAEGIAPEALEVLATLWTPGSDFDESLAAAAAI
jgi:hypothetical protein